jgi:hypothetical protein
MSNDEASEKEGKHFWETATGIILSLIALLTAIITCVGAILGSPRILDFFFPAASPTPIIITSTPLPPAVVTPTPISSENMPSPSPMTTVMVMIVTETAPQPIVQTPKMYGFALCAGSCDGTNTMTNRFVPERADKINAQWSYENIPVGSDYVRTWSVNGQEWVRYHCVWPGPESGIYTVTLKEPRGLKSGVWEMTVIVNGEVLMREQVEVLGNYLYWDPAGTFEKCK